MSGSEAGAESAADDLSRALLVDARAVADRWPEERMRVLAHLARGVTETPWSLGAKDAEAARAAGFTEEHIVHAVALSAFFGHLNRIADAVDVPLDYPVLREPPRAEPATPPYRRAPRAAEGGARFSLADRPATAAALEAWRSYVMERDSGLLDRPARARMAAHVGALLGQASPDATAISPVDAALFDLAERVTLAPWRLGEAAYAPLHKLGFDEASIFDAVVVASTAGVRARIEVALSALASG